MMSLLLLLLLASSPGLIQCHEVSSYTVHILYDATDTDSVDARDHMYSLFCRQFVCDDDFWDGDHPGVVLVDTVYHERYQVPMDLFPAVLSWFMQFRTARVSGASADLDIAVHPDTDLDTDSDYWAGWEEDYLDYRVWGGRNHPVYTNNIYLDHPVSENSNTKTAPKEEEDTWAYTCSSDATGEVHYAI